MLMLFIALCVVSILAAGLAAYCYKLCAELEEKTARSCDLANEAFRMANRDRFDAEDTCKAVNMLYGEMCGMVNSVHKVREELAKPATCVRQVTERDLSYLKSIVEAPHCFAPTGSPVSPVTPICGDQQHEVLASVEAEFGARSPEVTAESDPVLYAQLMDALRSDDSLTDAPPKHDSFGIRPLPNGDKE